MIPFATLTDVGTAIIIASAALAAVGTLWKSIVRPVVDLVKAAADAYEAVTRVGDRLNKLEKGLDGLQRQVGDRIDGVESKLKDYFDRLTNRTDKVEARVDSQDARIHKLEARVEQLDRRDTPGG